MNRYALLPFAILPIVVISGVLLLHFFAKPIQADSPSARTGLDKEFALFMEVRDNLLTRWDGDVDPQLIDDGALVGAAAALGDRYTHVNPPLEARTQDLELKGSFYGIGAMIRANKDGSLLIRSVNREGPAERAGVRQRDVIVAVDGVSILGQPYESSRQRIQSEVKGSVVKLTLLRGGDGSRGDDAGAERLELSVTRGVVVEFSVHYDHIEQRDGRKFGYLRLSGFNDNTFDPQFKAALARLVDSGAEGLVIDLRGNGGGKVNVALDIVDSLIAEKDKLIVFTHSTREANRANDKEYRTRDDSALTALPVVLLVDRGSASASEIVTGALKDNGRAVVVGERTYGKGLVQSVIQLKTDAQYSMNITTTQYYTPLGRKVQNGLNGERGGIQPHVEIRYSDEAEYRAIYNKLKLQESRIDAEDLLETDEEKKAWKAPDRMLDAALDLLAGKPVTIKD